MMQNKKITASDVALYAGVSRSAVSRAFTEGASIDPIKQEKILAAAKVLGYQPNFFARNLSTPTARKRSHLVAILVSGLSNPYESYLFEALTTALQAHGKQPILLNVKQAHDLENAIMQLSGYQVDGVIAIVGSLPVEYFSQCLKLSLPLVTLGRTDERGIIPSIQTDNIKAGEIAADYLLKQGSTKLGFVAGRVDGQASVERLMGFQNRLLNKGGIIPICLDAGSYDYQAGFAMAVQKSDDLHRLDGVFCASDALAMGVIDCCRQILDIPIPRRLSVVGCDDVPMAAWQGYQITTVAQPVVEIASNVIVLLEKIWAKSENIHTHIRLEPYLQRRNT